MFYLVDLLRGMFSMFCLVSICLALILALTTTKCKTYIKSSAELSLEQTMSSADKQGLMTLFDVKTYLRMYMCFVRMFFFLSLVSI